VLADGVVVGRIFKANAAPVGSPWMWTLAFRHREDRTPTQRLCRDARGGELLWMGNAKRRSMADRTRRVAEDTCN
jgi:hypothetical protein